MYGGSRYSELLPPHSYINAREFESPLKLANYLKHLVLRPKEYAKYFEWKKHSRYYATKLTPVSL